MYFYFQCECLTIGMYMHIHMCMQYLQRSEDGIDSLELELQIVVSHHMVLRTEPKAPVRGVSSQSLSHLSIPLNLSSLSFSH